jgi:quinol monooxygenase YgiN
MIHVIATITVNPGLRDKFLAVFNRNVPAVQAEEGCLFYGPSVDLATGLPPQLPLRENVVTIVEQWESLDHLRAHLAAPHMATYRENVKDLVQGVSLQVLQPV